MVEGLCGRLAVECDGDEYHGMEQWEDDQIRQRELSVSAGLLDRTREATSTGEPDAALTELWETLERLKITPRHAWESDRKQSKKESTTEDSIPDSDVTEAYRENLRTMRRKTKRRTKKN